MSWYWLLSMIILFCSSVMVLCVTIERYFSGPTRIVKTDYVKKQTVILTDSLSCLYAIKDNPFRSRLRSSVILKIREALFSCHHKGIQIALVWIPSHSGIPGNETADSCAKAAVQSGCINHFEISSQDLRSLAKSSMDKSWHSHWNSSKSEKGCGLTTKA
ncbi:uncharacterized protein LOC123670466 [Melitaea cinxia]|uniref:uncharacterized protein LOC123670466 n=1 Tax=Melitaea cinxia TaxID=113334 RepID=UPI001E271646|nr:uncharacterized protein LOC123670466 [Melitaea cinxia]